MSDEHPDRVAYEVVGLAQLTDEQAEQARALRDLCNRAGGLDLKLGISTTLRLTPSQLNHTPFSVR